MVFYLLAQSRKMRREELRKVNLFFALVICFMFLSTASYSAIIYVKTDGNDANSGLSWELAKKTVNAALAVSVSGDEIWVAAGTYVEKIALQNGVKLYGGFTGNETALEQRNWKTNATVLDGNGNGMVVASLSGVTNTARIDGFVIQNGKFSYGGGISCTSSSPVICNNLITGNTAEYFGGGIYCFNSSPAIFNNTISDNSTDSFGGGIYINGYSPTISNNTIIGNNGESAGGGIYCRESAPIITNNTIAGNFASRAGGIYCDYSKSSPSISNNIVAYNSSGIYGYPYNGTSPTLRNNCVYNPGCPNYTDLSPGTGDISVDPKLAAYKYGQVHIQSDSLCIDAGYDTAVTSGSVDMDGQARILGLHVDIGADESNGDDWTYSPRIIRVSTTGSDENDGSSWELSKKTITAAIDAASLSGCDIWVAKGVYAEQLQLRSYVHVYGGFAGNETEINQRNIKNNVSILDGNSVDNVVDATNIGHRTASVDGFHIRNGSRGVYCVSSAPIISNCTIKGNSDSGIYCEYASPAISNNTIINNSANYGGGIFCNTSSSPVIYNNIIANNSAVRGGGISCVYSSSVISNNTICCNNASSYGGGLYCEQSSHPAVSNNIISYNASGIHCVDGSYPVIRNNCVYNPEGLDYNYQSVGIYDIQTDPKLFAYHLGYFHLQSSSPCIDSGNDAYVIADSLDIDGEARVWGSHVDIGADEFITPWVPSPKMIKVSVTGNDANDGSSWDKAFRTIKAGLDAAEGGDQVWVSAGLYTERVTLKFGVALYGGFPANGGLWESRNPSTYETIINANAAGTAVTVSAISIADPLSIMIDGFTIKNGNATNGGGINCTNSAATVANCKIVSNTASSGAGIYCHNSAIDIRNNVIQANSGTIGGGMFIGYSNGNATNNIITNNTVTGANGGGIQCSSSMTAITNNTIAYNQSSTRGGGISCNSHIGSIMNNIVAFNSTGIYRISGTSTLRNNCVYNPSGANYTGISAGVEDISLDPLFKDSMNQDYHLSDNSPCINAGYNDAVVTGWRDMDGQYRIIAFRVDIGADEQTGPEFPVGAAKKLADGLPIVGYGAIVTAVFGDYFYIESSNRSSGILVKKAGHTLASGMTAQIDGVLATNEDGEHYIVATEAAQCGIGSVEPVYMIGRNLGGGLALGQRGVEAGAGLNNVGLLVKLTGKLKLVGCDYFVLDDGSKARDSLGSYGIRVMNLQYSPTYANKLVSVVGISSIIKVNNKYYRCVRALNVALINTAQ